MNYASRNALILALGLRASSLSDLGDRRETVGERGQICARSRRIVGLFNENARVYGPLLHRRSRFVLSSTGC